MAFVILARAMEAAQPHGHPSERAVVFTVLVQLNGPWWRRHRTAMP
jgi:hypothetical protein